MSLNECLENIIHNFVVGLPDVPTPHTIYFVRTESGVNMYVTDSQGNLYAIGGTGGGGSITLTSPNGTISIVGEGGIDVSQEVLDSIIKLHNNFPDLQGGRFNEYFHLNEVEWQYLTEIVENDTIGQLQDTLNLLIPRPTYVPPTSSITNVSGIFEVGSSVNIQITQTFNQNNGGQITSQNIIKNGVQVSSTNTFNETLGINLGNTTYSGTVSYGQGACINNIINLLDCRGRIPAGLAVSAPRVVTGALRTYASSVSTFPLTGAAIRTALLNTSILNAGNTFTFQTGTTNRRFIIAIPANKSLTTVQNTGTNEFITFTLSNTLTTIPDAAANNQSYKVYTLENAVPFSSNYTLNVTTT